MRRTACAMIVVLAAASAARGDTTATTSEGGVPNFRSEFLPYVVKAVPGILRSQDKKTGRFGTGIWIVNDQHAMWPLAVAWGTSHKDNPYYHSPEVLEAIMVGGDALIDDMDGQGRWEFRKKDGSTWGPIHMPWTYSRWIRAYGIVRDAMPKERRERWDKAITLGVENIITTHLNQPIQNIPAHHAMGVYRAGQIFDRDDWKEAAAAYLRKTANEQDPGGFWSEHVGPVINYNFVYVDAIGTYYGMSKDDSVRECLARASRYHAHFTYPDGRPVETVDERNSYDRNRGIGGVGFTFSPEGRGFISQQSELMKADGQPVGADQAASIVAYGEDGRIVPTPRSRQSDRFVLGKNDAMTARQGPWFAVLSAYTAPIPQSRWILDRQNFVSLYHDKIGSTIFGGGNTKLQPLWSSFTVGDPKLLAHKPGDENPNFAEPDGLIHVPSKAALEPDGMSLKLTYGKVECRMAVDVTSPERAVITYALESKSELPVEAHATFIPQEKLEGEWRTKSGKSGTLKEPFRLTSEEAGGAFEYRGYRVELPAGSTVVWPALPHNQYRKDGHAELFEGRIVVVMPLGTDPGKRDIVVEVR